MKRITALFVAAALMICTPAAVKAEELMKGRATVYSLSGKTKMNTDVHYGICATGNMDLYGKYIIIYQRKPDNTKGDCLGIYHVEDTGCKKEVIDIWCPVEWQNMIINKTYENGCEGKIFIQVLE